jgi:hypothetical protein
VALVADELPRAHATADWRPTAASFRQCIEAARVPDGSRPQAELRGALALALSRIRPVYHGSEELMGRHAYAVFAAALGYEAFTTETMRMLYEDRQAMVHGAGGRTSGPVEAVVETCRRHRDAGRIRDALANSRSAGVLTGSTSYSPFYNVRGTTGERPGSDLDLIVVVAEVDDLPGAGERLAGVPGVHLSGLRDLDRRARTFLRRYHDGRTMFSHKVSMWAARSSDPLLPWPRARCRYQVSVHFLTPEVLEYALVASSTAIMPDVSGRQRTVRDYRRAAPLSPDVRTGFDARHFRVDVRTERAVAGELRTSWLYIIDENERYFPGLIQLMLLPPREVLWDGTGVLPRLEAFRHKVGERLRLERVLRPHDAIASTFSLARRDSFAPHVLRELDYAD